MIREISREEVGGVFDLMGELEIGASFDEGNDEHIAWLTNKIGAYFFNGVKFFGYFNEEKELIGFIALDVEEPLKGVSWIGKKAEILYIAVYPKYRQKSYGTQLIDYVNQYCRDRGVYCIYVSTAAFNYAVIVFYGKNQYVPVATLPDVHGPNAEGLVCMRKVLT